MSGKPFIKVIFTIALIFLIANPAMALQSHGGIEGLAAHQIGHFLFAVGMGYLLFRLYQLKIHQAGWLEFKIFLWLIIAWNITTFSGHWMNEFVNPEKFIKADGITIAFSIQNFSDFYFYLTRLDHLLLVPSFLFLLLALRKWRLQK
jgi:hypothetical protein